MADEEHPLVADDVEEFEAACSEPLIELEELLHQLKAARAGRQIELLDECITVAERFASNYLRGQLLLRPGFHIDPDGPQVPSTAHRQDGEAPFIFTVRKLGMLGHWTTAVDQQQPGVAVGEVDAGRVNIAMAPVRKGLAALAWELVKV